MQRLMQPRKWALAAAVLLLTAGACNRFLDVEPQGVLTEKNFFQTPQDAVLGTNAIYNTLRVWFYHEGGYPILDIMSDDAYKGSNPTDAIDIQQYETFSFPVTQGTHGNWYTTLYQGIRRANAVVENVPRIGMDETLRNRLVGEARFLRGLYYFDLVRGFGGVPIVLSTNPEVKVSKASEGEVYAQIQQDLEFAIANLPERSSYKGPDVGRASKGAARALLARAFLYQKNWAMAEQYALEVINSGQYGLEADFSRAFRPEGFNGIESVFEVGALQVDNPTGGGNQYANTQGVRGAPNRGWGFNRPSMELMRAFEPGDPRLEKTVVRLGEVLDGIMIRGDLATLDSTVVDGVTVEREVYNEKVWMPGSTTVEEWGYHRKLIRYADVLLMAAEALTENGKAAQALPYLNLVRQRARQGDTTGTVLPDVTATDPALLREIIRRERRVELALEGWRFNDLVRWGIAPQVLGTRGFMTGKHERLPIPQVEIDITEGAITQNPGW